MSTIVAFIEKKDIGFFYFLNRRLNCPPLNIFMKSVTLLGSFAFAIFLTLTLLFANRKMGVALMLNLTTAQIAIQSLKRLINRPRPYRTHQWVLSLNPPKCKYSFPSGHSCTALSIALAVSCFIPGLMTLLIPIAAIVGLSRIYLGYHYPTDVSVGFIISIIVYELTKIFITI